MPFYGVKYAYVTDSNLIDKLDFMTRSSATIGWADYTYEANRDLVTVVENMAGLGTMTTFSKYDYDQGDGSDVLGRRTSVVYTGLLDHFVSEHLRSMLYVRVGHQ